MRKYRSAPARRRQTYICLASNHGFSGETPGNSFASRSASARPTRYAAPNTPPTSSRLAEQITAIIGSLCWPSRLKPAPRFDWRRDYRHGKESGTAYFRRIPYLDFAAVGDHKFIWELNRHQHLVLLAQAYLLTKDERYSREIFREIDSWIEQNPFQRGINWTSALEVAFRALSWIWVYHFVGSEMSDRFRRNFLTALYRHGRHLYENLSVYFSPNTHLLGEAVALHALGALFPNFKGSDRLARAREATSCLPSSISR